MRKLWNLAVVGATGAVGGQIIDCLDERDFPVGKLRFLASGRSAGQILEFRGKGVAVEELCRDSFAGIDIALFSAGSSRSGEFCPVATGAGAVCIDNSSAWRMDPSVPLVVPEVNHQAIAGYAEKGIIASPHASVIQMVVALKPLHDYGGIRRLVISTYQSVSGTGRKAIEELRVQTIDLMNGRPAKCKVYPHRIAFNCLAQTDSFGPNGYTNEEMEVADEIRKAMAADIKVSATTVRVPVFYGHCASVNIETERKISVDTARELLAGAAGCQLVDDTKHRLYPMPSEAAGQDLTMVGRVRPDDTVENGLNLWLAADNIRKEAVNTVRIAEILIESYLK